MQDCVERTDRDIRKSKSSYHQNIVHGEQLEIHTMEAVREGRILLDFEIQKDMF